MAGLLWLASAEAGQEQLTPQQCGACHQEQFGEWRQSLHAKANGGGADCNQCHGTLHSCSLLGCKRCHAGEHETTFGGWKEVARFNVPGSADYYCMLCHNAHTSETRISGFCDKCHGKAGLHRESVDLVHRVCAKAVPITFDEYERGGAIGFPAYKKVLLVGGLSSAALLFLAVWPWCYVAVVAWRKIVASRKPST